MIFRSSECLLGDPRQFIGDFDGQERTLEVFNADALEQLELLRRMRPIREELEIATRGGTVRVLGREDELWRIETPTDALEFFETWGEVPLPRVPAGNV